GPFPETYLFVFSQKMLKAPKAKTNTAKPNSNPLAVHNTITAKQSFSTKEASSTRDQSRASLNTSLANAPNDERNYLLHVLNVLTSDPMIQRTLSVPPTLTFASSTKHSRSPFGWMDSHMHVFTIEAPYPYPSNNPGDRIHALPKTILALNADPEQTNDDDEGMAVDPGYRTKDEKKWTLYKTYSRSRHGATYASCQSRTCISLLNLLAMSKKSLPSDLPILSFPSTKELEAYLDDEHRTASGFHLKIAKKSSGIPTVSAAHAVEIALCFGWIDGQANAFDDDWWLVRYTPRRPKSLWSKKNVATIGRLIEEDRMRPAGIAAVEAAKADGRWQRAYAGSATIEVPGDLTAALVAQPAAAAFFEGMNKTDRYSVLWRVETASPRGRGKRIESLVSMMADGKKPGVRAKPKLNVHSKNAATNKAKLKQALQDPAHNKTAKEQPTPGTKTVPRRAGLRTRS
ncbi:MAG: hypothetical protein Q9210_007105, partial [Variospora velana]